MVTGAEGGLYTFSDEGLREAEQELGVSERFMLTVPPEAAW